MKCVLFCTQSIKTETVIATFSCRKVISKFYGVMMKGFSNEAKSNLPALLEGLEWFDSSMLAARANPFLHGKGSTSRGC